MWVLNLLVILGNIHEGLSIQPLPIIFDRTPVNVTVIAGNTAVLPCIVENRGAHQIIWMTPQKVLISTEDRRVIDDMRMSIERPFVRDWNLHIRIVELKDNGIYTCQVNTNPIQIKRINLNVLVPATIIDETSSNDIVVKEGETVQLTCNATGVPEPSVSWYRHTEQLAKERWLIIVICGFTTIGRVTQSSEVGTIGEILLIHNISRYCGGVYECVADNDLTEPAVKEIHVDVEFAPEVMLRTSRIGQYRGRETILECLVTAFPQANCLWKKGEIPVSIPPSTSWKYRTELYKENEHTVALYLRIINLEESDYGLYTCEASNRLGHDSRDMFLYEYHDPTTRRPSTKVPMPNGIESVKSSPRHNDAEDEFRYLDYSHNVQTTYKPDFLRPDHYQKPQGVYNTGYAGAGDLYNNSSSLSKVISLWLLICTISYCLLVSSVFPFRR